jgi:hypothetical protein
MHISPVGPGSLRGLFLSGIVVMDGCHAVTSPGRCSMNALLDAVTNLGVHGILRDTTNQIGCKIRSLRNLRIAQLAQLAPQQS